MGSQNHSKSAKERFKKTLCPVLDRPCEGFIPFRELLLEF
jgi:hypothetical protein